MLIPLRHLEECVQLRVNDGVGNRAAKSPRCLGDDWVVDARAVCADQRPESVVLQMEERKRECASAVTLEKLTPVSIEGLIEIERGLHAVRPMWILGERYMNHRFYQVGVVWFCRLGRLAC